jgi:VanZ family protein
VIGGSLLPDATPLKTAIDDSGISDVILHFAPYCVLAFLPVLFERRRTVLALTIVLPLLGVALEFAQEFVGRTFGIGDIAANTAGVLCGWCAGARVTPGLRSNHASEPRDLPKP